MWWFRGCVGSGIRVPVSVSGLFPDAGFFFSAGSEVFPVGSGVGSVAGSRMVFRSCHSLPQLLFRDTAWAYTS